MADDARQPQDKKPLSGAFDAAAAAPARNVMALSRLRPTQITVGMKQVEAKQEKLQKLMNRPSELMDYLLERPVRVVMGPDGNAYVIDRHHFALALIREGYETAPIEVVKDFSADKMSMADFWKKMQELKYVHPMDENGKERPVSDIPARLTTLKDDPYRALAGFVREELGFRKVETPFAEFEWADYFRTLIPEKLLEKDFDKAVKKALKLSRAPEAKHLPGYSATDFNRAARPPAKPAVRPVMELAKLLPTQITVGMKQVDSKQEKLAALRHRPAELLDSILEHTIPVVMGPGGKAYVIDHHHYALAMLKEGFETAPVKIVADYSGLSEGKFWKKMEDMKYCHPVDAHGKTQSTEDIPKHLTSLKDDPYRAIAGFVRDALGFKKVETPFAEFDWADYFRKLIPQKMVDNHFDKAIKKALKLCHLPGAKDLPGFKPR